MKLPVVLAVLVGIFALACSSAAPAPTESTSKINATVETRLSEDKPSLPTATRRVPLPTNTPKSGSTNTRAPTTKPTQIPDITQIRKPTEFVSSKDYREFDTDLRALFQVAVDNEFLALKEKSGLSVAVYTDK